jgi:hypothetical protein
LAKGWRELDGQKIFSLFERHRPDDPRQKPKNLTINDRHWLLEKVDSVSTVSTFANGIGNQYMC